MAEITTSNSQVADRNRLRNDGSNIRVAYPLDLEENYPHAVDFTIYLPQKSAFEKTIAKVPNSGQNRLSNYDGIGSFGDVTGLAQVGFGIQTGFQVAKDAATGGAIGGNLAGGRGVVGAVTRFLGGAVGAAAGAASSAFTNSKTQAGIKGLLATELIQEQTKVTGLKLERTAQKISKMISLYMPANFFTTYGHDYDQISMKEAGGMLGMLAGAYSSTGGMPDLSSIANDPAKFLEAIKSLPGAANPYTALAAGALGSSTNVPILGGPLVGSNFADISLFNMGYAQNPMLEVIYRGTNFRSFQFEFMFQPKSQKEAERVREIIETFKFHAAAETNPIAEKIGDGSVFPGGNSMPMFFVPPSEFGIELRHGSIQNKFLPKIGRCVLNRIDVDYAPGGQWQTFADGVPIETRIRLDFTEVELITKNKIQEGY
jgi:hypothetical protein